MIEVVRGDCTLIANLGRAPTACRGEVMLANRLEADTLSPDGCAIVRRGEGAIPA